MRSDVCLSLFTSVDEEDDYECVTVLNSHTQDVKHIVWHPNQEVGPTQQGQDYYYIVFLILSYCIFTLSVSLSCWPQLAMITTSVFTKKMMMTGSVAPH